MASPDWIQCPSCQGWHSRQDIRPCGTCGGNDFLIVRRRLELRDGRSRIDCLCVCKVCVPTRHDDQVVGRMNADGVITLFRNQRNQRTAS